jgi:hemoglobin
MTHRAWHWLPIACVAAGMALAPVAASAAGDSLYRALGAKKGITAFIGTTLAIAVKDPRIGHEFDDISIDWLTQRVTLQICQLTGGPCHYPGQSMYKAHKGLHLTTFDFNAFVEDLQIAMNRQGVPFHTQNRLLAILAPMYHQVVTR